MTAARARAGAEWLALREPADAAARSPELVELLRAHLPTGSPLVVHDLGCGTGSMGRWLAGQLNGRQHWVLHDRDADLLAVAANRPPGRASDGSPVSTETRRGDITRLDTLALSGAGLVTASALLDVLTADELDRLVETCARVGCPVLITLSVSGRVDLTPSDPLDQRLTDAFNAHQRRTTPAGRLLGPDAVEAARRSLSRLGLEVQVRASPWRLGPDRAALAAEWFAGWLAAACEQEPELRGPAESYARRRLAQAAAGGLSVTVHHEDLVAWPG